MPGHILKKLQGIGVYAKRALTPRSLNMKLGPQRNYHKGRAAIRLLHDYEPSDGPSFEALVETVPAGRGGNVPIMFCVSATRHKLVLAWPGLGCIHYSFRH